LSGRRTLLRAVVKKASANSSNKLALKSEKRNENGISQASKRHGCISGSWPKMGRRDNGAGVAVRPGAGHRGRRAGGAELLLFA